VEHDEAAFTELDGVALKEVPMTLIKLRMANEKGDETGTVFINVDQIVSVSVIQGTTTIQTADGKPHWVKNTPDEVVALVKSSRD